MDWQQKVFRRAWHWLLGQRDAESQDDSSAIVMLEQVRSRLTIFARLLTGEAIEILTAEAEGGWNDCFYYLPAKFELGDSSEENLNFYLFRVAYLTLQRELNLNLHTGDYSLELSRQQAYESRAAVLERLFETYPACETIYERFLGCLEARGVSESEAWPIWGHWMESSQQGSGKFTSMTLNKHAAEPSSEPETLLEAPARERVEILEADREAIRKYNLQHYYEKVETIEEFQGTWRDTDGGDDLSEHAEALQEVDMRQVVRSDDPVHSVFQTEFLPGMGTPESKDRVASGYFVSYSEWDYKKKSYRPDWCRVYPAQASLQDADYVSQTLQQHRLTQRKLAQRFARIYNEHTQIKAQLSGDELDLDRLVDRAADIQAGCSPAERVYIQRRRQQRDLSILFLLDLSLSSDGYTGGQRVLDVEKQAVILFGNLLNEYGDNFQVDGFSSRTRHHCDYQTFKHFDQPWQPGAARVGAAEASGYTRIGPALRHSTALLREQRTRSRWIILLSDGKPNDYDRYEGQYGLKDVRQSIKEARQSGVQIYGLAVEAVAQHYLPLMLGHGSYRILPHAAQLPEALSDLYERLTHR